MPVLFSVTAIKINSIENNSVFNIGQNIVIGFTNSATNNQGTGQSFGDGIMQPANAGAGFDNSTTGFGNQNNGLPTVL